jgi:hypothetical protein
MGMVSDLDSGDIELPIPLNEHRGKSLKIQMVRQLYFIDLNQPLTTYIEEHFDLPIWRHEGVVKYRSEELRTNRLLQWFDFIQYVGRWETGGHLPNEGIQLRWIPPIGDAVSIY